ncbi:MAG: hypothetical protein AAGC60_30585 [Acidobacteriota bacterium]
MSRRPEQSTVRAALVGAGVGLVALTLLALLRAEPEWKEHQRSWRAHRLAVLDARLDAVGSASSDDLAEVKSTLRAAQKTVDHRAIAELEREIHGLERQRRRAVRDHAAAEEGAVAEEARLRRMEVESLDEMIAQRRERLDDLLVEERDAEAQMAALHRPLETLEAARAALRPLPFAELPILRRLDPSLRVLEVGPGGERCVTCHVGLAPRLDPAAQDAVSTGAAATEYAPTPWFAAAHPRTDLLGPGTSHPFEAVGCVVCHGGDGDALSFDASGHRAGTESSVPRAASQVPDPVIVGGGRAEAGCVTCHSGEVWIERAPTQQAGLRVAANLGCGGCHTTGRPVLDEASTAGPSLVDLPTRAPRSWTADYLRAPRQHRLGAWMPALWVDTDEATREVEIAAVVAWLWQARPPQAVDDVSIDRGDPAEGRRLLATRGCLACHLGPDEAVDASTSLERRRGPHLGSVGHFEPTWLGRWLLEPSAVHPATPMPSLRLDTDEATAIAAALLEESTDKADEAEPHVETPKPDARALESLVRTALLEHTTVEQTAALLETSDQDERLVALGRHVAASRGCAGCHLMPVVEPSSAIEAALAGATPTIEPSKAPSLARIGTRFDSVVARATSEDASAGSWLDVVHPRLGRFALDESLLLALEAQLRGLRPPPAPQTTSPLRAASNQLVEHAAAVGPGRVVMEQLGCRACHSTDVRTLDEASADPTTGNQLSWPDAPSTAPAPLILAGRKLRARWLVDYLAAPETETLRPFSPLRMPSYRYPDTALDAIARALAASAEVPLLEPPPSIDPGRRAIGEVLFGVLQCDSCHPGESSATSLDVPAPRYTGAGERLRHRFVVDWLLAPRTINPHTAMPSFFTDDGTKPDASFLAATLDAPMFSIQQARLQRLFASNADYRATITDAEAVAQALADYLATLE